MAATKTLGNLAAFMMERNKTVRHYAEKYEKAK